MGDRSRPYKRRPTEAFEKVREQAQQSRFFVLQSLGPTSFVLRDEAEHKFKACIGSRHSCSCGHCGDEHCVHTAFVLLKILRVPPDNPLCWQTSLTDGEITEVLAARQREMEQREQEAQRAERRAAIHAKRRSRQQGEASAPEHAEEVERLPFADDDTCPICCEPFLPEGPAREEGTREHTAAMRLLTFCKTGCKRTIHSQCMKHWADHRVSMGEDISCPLCRATWPAQAMVELRRGAGLALRRKAVFWGHSCKRCRMVPVRGVLHGCLLCDPPVELCEDCFLHPSDPAHIKHPFVRLSAPGAAWAPALRTVHDTQVQLNRLREQHRRQQQQALAQILAERELGPEDYEFLQQLDRPAAEPEGPAVALVETEEPLTEYLVRVVAEHEPARVEWNRARADFREPGPVRGRCPPPHAAAPGAADGCAFVCGSAAEARLLRLRCGHAVHRTCLQARAEEAPSTTSAAESGRKQAPSLECPRCAAPALPGWAAMCRPPPEPGASPAGPAGESGELRGPHRAAPQTAPALSVVGGGLAARAGGEAPGPLAAEVQSSSLFRAAGQSPARAPRRPGPWPQRSASAGGGAPPLCSPEGPRAGGAGLGRLELCVGSGPPVPGPSEEALLRRARLPLPPSLRRRSASARAGGAGAAAEGEEGGTRGAPQASEAAGPGVGHSAAAVPRPRRRS